MIELLVVVAIIGLLAALLLPSLVRAKEQARVLHCLNNLKQVAVAFRVFSLDREAYFPWHTPPSEGGTFGSVAGEGWRNYLAASNELITPRILKCSSDRETVPGAVNWFDGSGGFANAAFQGKALSYFTGLDGYEQIPATLLAGDRNIAGAPVGQCSSVCPLPGIAALDLNAKVKSLFWTNAVHDFEGNVALADGSVQRLKNPGLRLLAADAMSAIRAGSQRTATGALPDNHILLPR
jgi:type II secretory pathway pseudopilin PulG